MPRVKSTKNKDQLTMLTTADKSCMYCDKPINDGRSDKKFCDNLCRNNYNNVLKSADNNLIRNINNALSKNRRILQAILNAGQTKATKQELLKAGFLFSYHTSSRTNKNGGIYYYCYEYGYLLTAKDYLIVKQKINSF